MAVPNVERVEWDGLTSIPFVSTRPVAQLRQADHQHNMRQHTLASA